MKKSLFLLIILALGSCTPLDHAGDDTRARDRDEAKGEPEWTLPDIGELEDPRKIRESLDQGSCSDYENNVHVSILGKNSWLKPLSNCIAYNIDKGLKPLCELEENVKDSLGNSRDEEALEDYLILIEEEKEAFLDYIYEISDEIYEFCGDIEDLYDQEVKSWERPNDKIGERMLKRFLELGGDLVINRECRSVYRSIDFKAKSACRGLNLSNLLRK